MTGALLDILKALASASSAFLILSPSPSLYRIHKQRSCGEVQVLPLVSLWMSCHIWMMYGYLSGNIFPLFATYVFGSVMSIAYLAVYVRYTEESMRVRKLIAVVCLWNTFILLLSFSGEQFMGITRLSNKDTGKLVGYIANVNTFLLYASPFATLARVIKTKSVATIPITMVVVGIICSLIWVAYGFADWDMIVTVPNIVCVIFGCVQAAVYAIYRPKTSPEVDLTDRLTAAESLEKKDARRSPLSTIELAGGGFQALWSPV